MWIFFPFNKQPGLDATNPTVFCFDFEKSYCEYHRSIALSTRRFTLRLLAQSKNFYSVQLLF